MNEHDDHLMEQTHADILRDLRGLRGDLERQRYPGKAWNGPPRANILQLRWIGLAAAAAAMILLAVTAVSHLTPTQPIIADLPDVQQTMADLAVFEELANAPATTPAETFLPAYWDLYDWPVTVEDSFSPDAREGSSSSG